VGVAGAIAIGGPGAVFWMWITALVGMATKYSEAVLAVKYREVDERGKHQGGPMYYIKNGLGKNWTWLAFLFALFGALAAFGIGNGVQSNAVATNLFVDFGVPKWITGIILSTLVALVIIGGVHRIGAFAGKIVPIMAVFYVGGALLIIFTNIAEVPTAITMIFKAAFTGSAAVGGFVGATIMIAIQTGIARGLFSNEAGMGTAPIAHAAAKTNDPVKQGTIGMLGTFLDTIVICTMTALVIIIMNGWTQVDAETGKLMSKAAITSYSFSQGLAGYGQYIVTLGMIFFTFTTMIGWSFYGERCAEYLLGIKVIVFYRILWVLVAFIGTTLNLDMVWIIAEILNGLMAIPNLIALLLLSPIVFKLTRDHYNSN
jgi:AGCS family alanine or glycine:cation symporter